MKSNLFNSPASLAGYTRCSLCLIALAFLLPLLARAQPFEVNWQTVGGGANSSSGGPYALAGQIGMVGDGSSSGGQFAIEAGLWAFEPLDLPNAPSLHILRAGTNIILSWPTSAVGFSLQQTASLLAPSWTDVGAPVVVIGSENTITLPASAVAQFYRLRASATE